ncbi:hypothetical protein ACFP2T_35735 [Plantactinospora solaniradicis]|uniref:Phage tail protein n=1 Tax=Plantactinospora solaniradicis TaxID=1723736 RepID=A0ABW1KKU9_9ACTN
MAEWILHGDPAGAAVDILTNYTPELTPYALTNIAKDLVGWSKPQRWITVTREGGLNKWPKISKPRLDFYIYAESDNACQDISNIAEASLFRAAKIYRGCGVRIHRVVEEVGAIDAYDRLSESNRYFFTLRLTTTPDPETIPLP